MSIDMRSVATTARQSARLVARQEGVAWMTLSELRDLDAARRALPEVDGELLLVCGGADVDDRRALAGWARRARQRAAAVLLYGPAAGAMAAAIGATTSATMVVRCADALDASIAAARLAADGDTILLCPGRPTEIGTPEPGPVFARVAHHPDQVLTPPSTVEAA